MTALPSRYYSRDPALIAEENEIAALRRQRRTPINPFEEQPMTADDLLHNWARGEWAGDYPHPVPPRRCASVEGNFNAPSDMGSDDIDPYEPVNWDNHKLVNDYYRRLRLIDQRILQYEYTRRHEFGDLKKNARQEKAARLLHLSIHAYRGNLTAMQSDIEAKARNR